MVNKFMLGFGAVAVLAVAGVDYIVQAEAAGQKPGAFAITDYVDTYAGRFSTMRAEQTLASRQSTPAKTHLPEAPDGWERRDWVPDPEGSFEWTEGLLPGEQPLAKDAGANPIARLTRQQEHRTATREAKARIWEYANGPETIRLSARFDPPEDPETVSDLAMQMASANLDLVMTPLAGYGVVQGVPFFHMTGGDGSVAVAQADPEAVQPFQLTAQIGRDITLDAVAMARPASLRLLLERIDYDALNAMLDRPLAGVGSKAPPLTPQEELIVANAAAAARLGGEVERAAQLEATLLELGRSMTGRQPEGGSGQVLPSGSGGTLSKVTGFFQSVKAATGAGAEAAPRERIVPQRLQLSGGSACLAGSAGRFCRE